MRNFTLLTITTIFVLSLGFTGCEVGEYEQFQQNHSEETLDQLDGLFVYQDDNSTELDWNAWTDCPSQTHAQCGGQRCSRTATCQWKNNSCQCIDVTGSPCETVSSRSVSDGTARCLELEIYE